MHKDSINICEPVSYKNFDFFNTKVIHSPKQLNKATRCTLAIILCITNIFTVPYIMEAGKKTGEMVGNSLTKSLQRDITSLK